MIFLCLLSVFDIWCVLLTCFCNFLLFFYVCSKCPIDKKRLRSELIKKICCEFVTPLLKCSIYSSSGKDPLWVCDPSFTMEYCSSSDDLITFTYSFNRVTYSYLHRWITWPKKKVTSMQVCSVYRMNHAYVESISLYFWDSLMG